MNTIRYFLCIGVVSVFVTGFAQAEPRVPVGWTVPLAQLGMDGTLDDLAEHPDWDVKQVSSYDRTGGNNDDQYAHQIYDNVVVLADLEGPGVVTRIWSKNPHGLLYLMVDDMEKPVLVAPFEDIFSGAHHTGGEDIQLFAAPFTGSGSGGHYSYVPIPYEQTCRILVVGAEDSLGYQVTYADLPDNTPIESFALPLTEDDVDFFENWSDNWNNTDFRMHDPEEEILHHSRHKYWPRKDTLVYPMEGPGVITELEMIVESHEKEIMDNTWISISFDKEDTPSVYAPIGDFFGSANKDDGDFDTLALGNIEGRMWCRYPMPFNEYAEIRFITDTDQIADIEYFITWKKGGIGEQGKFKAHYNSGTTKDGEPYNVADIKGKGHYVGTSISATNADSLSMLEGDDVILVDGDTNNALHGTGTDDYVNAGWYFGDDLHSAATHGVSRSTQKAPAGFSAFRSHFTEPIPFDRSFVFDLEHGPANDRSGIQYSSVAYWYQH